MTDANRRAAILLAALLILAGFVSAQLHESTGYVIPAGYQLPLPPAYEGQ